MIYNEYDFSMKNLCILKFCFSLEFLPVKLKILSSCH